MKDLTKNAIASAFKELLLEKKLTKITIKDITERTGINRQTFYYHFRDIIDLVEWICIHDVNEDFDKRNTFATWQESFLEIFSIMKREKPYILNIYRNVSLEILHPHLYNLVYPIIYKVVDECSRNFIVSEEDKKFLADFYKLAFVAIVEEWIFNGMEEKPELIIEKLGMLLKGTIENSFINMGKQKK